MSSLRRRRRLRPHLHDRNAALLKKRQSAGAIKHLSRFFTGSALCKLQQRVVQHNRPSHIAELCTKCLPAKADAARKDKRKGKQKMCNRVEEQDVADAFVDVVLN